MSPRTPLHFLILCLLALAQGCAHSPTTAELARICRTGMSRDKARRAFGQPRRVETRPPAGCKREDIAEQIGAFAGQFEKEHDATVQTCEVYWRSRGIMGLGIYWDYLFYGGVID